MFKRVLVLNRYGHLFLYGLLSTTLALSNILATPDVSYGERPWGDVIQQGAQAIQLQRLSLEQEIELGKQINDELIKAGKISLYKNPQINDYIQQIAKKLAPHTDRPQMPYIVQIVNDDSINAFATMGGYVYINTGLIKAASNEAELASVIGHEMGHIGGRHAIKQMRNEAIKSGILTAAGLDQKTWVQLGVKVGYTLPRSRQDELQADKMGLNSLTKAGYAPAAMISFMEKLMSKGGSTPAILSTHPNTNTRIKKLQEQINPQTANKGDGLNQQAYKSKVRALL